MISPVKCSNMSLLGARICVINKRLTAHRSEKPNVTVVCKVDLRFIQSKFKYETINCTIASFQMITVYLS